jgi:hypothetical protein
MIVWYVKSGSIVFAELSLFGLKLGVLSIPLHDWTVLSEQMRSIGWQLAEKPADNPIR